MSTITKPRTPLSVRKRPIEEKGAVAESIVTRVQPGPATMAAYGGTRHTMGSDKVNGARLAGEQPERKRQKNNGQPKRQPEEPSGVKLANKLPMIGKKIY